MYKYKTIITLVFVITTCPMLYAQEGDVAGSKDHPLFTRVPGSTIIKYDFKKFDEAILPLSKYLTLSGEFTKKKRVMGKATRIGYSVPEGRSTLEVMHSYKQALAEGEADILFECTGEEECGNAFDTGLNKQPGEETLFGMEVVEEESQRYVAARMNKAAGDIYVMVYAYYQYDTEKPYVRLRVIETEAEEQQLVTLNANAIKKALDTQGHLAIEGIHFDTDKATIRPESVPVLKEIAKVLNNNPDLKVYIVGHTDAAGSFAYNMELSSRRAQSVAAYLTEKLDVDSNQIESHGVGSLAPIASNATDVGQQQNRRVEIVKQ